MTKVSTQIHSNEFTSNHQRKMVRNGLEWIECAIVIRFESRSVEIVGRGNGSRCKFQFDNCIELISIFLNANTQRTGMIHAIDQRKDGVKQNLTQLSWINEEIGRDAVSFDVNGPISNRESAFQW